MTFFLIYSLKLHETPPALSRFSCCNASFFHPYWHHRINVLY